MTENGFSENFGIQKCECWRSVLNFCFICLLPTRINQFIRSLFLYSIYAKQPKVKRKRDDSCAVWTFSVVSPMIQVSWPHWSFINTIYMYWRWCVELCPIQKNILKIICVTMADVNQLESSSRYWFERKNKLFFPFSFLYKNMCQILCFEKPTFCNINSKIYS